jgi:uncharacterized protein (DUF2252 family)
MVARSVSDRIVQFNQGYPPARVALKYAAMSGSPFTFLRGTCHLFYETPPPDAPLAWACGDLHLQNFGTYKGEDRTVYFDINDFDEGALAPASWDLARWLTSLSVAATELGLDDPTALQTQFLAVYFTAIQGLKAKTLSQDTAEGFVRDCLAELANRRREDFLDERTEKVGKHRHIKAIEGKSILLTGSDRQPIEALLKPWQQSQPDPVFCQILDVADRIAGTGSLGLPRYLVLIEGKGSPDRNYFLDLKGARSSALLPYLPTPQPQFPSQADRIIKIQTHNQDSPPAQLSEITQNDQSYILRELQPTADKINLHRVKAKPKRLLNLITAMAQVTAWGHLRSSGRQGSASADDLQSWAKGQNPRALIQYATESAQRVNEDYATFSRDYEQGKLA